VVVGAVGIAFGFVWRDFVRREGWINPSPKTALIFSFVGANLAARGLFLALALLAGR
jgi:hypothetical protein